MAPNLQKEPNRPLLYVSIYMFFRAGVTGDGFGSQSPCAAPRRRAAWPAASGRLCARAAGLLPPLGQDKVGAKGVLLCGAVVCVFSEGCMGECRGLCAGAVLALEAPVDLKCVGNVLRFSFGSHADRLLQGMFDEESLEPQGRLPKTGGSTLRHIGHLP